MTVGRNTSGRSSAIEAVAVRAGVSKSTVSNTFTGRKSVSPKAKQRVMAAARELGYRPNHAAQVLATKRTRTIGVLVQELHNPHTSALVEALERELSRHGYKVMLGLTHGDHERALEYLRQFSTGMVDGAINLAPQVTLSQAVRESGQVPVVTYLRPHPESPAYVNYDVGVREALEHLWGLGHRRIGFIAIPDTAWDVAMEERQRAFHEAYTVRGKKPIEQLIVAGDGRAESGYRLGAVLAQRGATAIIAGNDLMACGVIRWCREAELRVPQDLSVIGIDDCPLATWISPALTSIQIPIALLAEVTVTGLLDRLEGQRPAQQAVLNARLVIRETTGRASDL